jgi:hypothetical protein
MQVVFDHLEDDEVRIYPGPEEIKHYAHTLPLDLKRRIDTWLERSSSMISASLRYQSQLDFITRALKAGEVQVIQAPEVGRALRIRREFRDRTAQGISIRGVSEEDYEAETFWRFHLKSTRYYPDGREAIEIAHWTRFTETTSEDFDAHDLRDVIPQARRRLTITPAEWVQMMLKREQLISGLKP